MERTDQYHQYKKDLKVYYLLTPVFAVLDYGFGIDIRLVMPGDSFTLEIIYYLVCFASPFFIFQSGLVAIIFSLAESTLNILLLILSVFIPVIMLSQNIDTKDANDFIFGMTDVLHFMLVGAVLLYGFYGNPLLARK